MSVPRFDPALAGSIGYPLFSFAPYSASGFR